MATAQEVEKIEVESELRPCFRWFVLAYRERLEQRLRWELFDPQPGDGVTVTRWSDHQAYTVIKRTPKQITLQRDKVERLSELEWIEGGFSAIEVSQHKQEWSYERDPNGVIEKATLRSDGKWWVTGHPVRGGRPFGRIAPGRHEYYDYNF